MDQHTLAETDVFQLCPLTLSLCIIWSFKDIRHINFSLVEGFLSMFVLS